MNAIQKVSIAAASDTHNSPERGLDIVLDIVRDWLLSEKIVLDPHLHLVYIVGFQPFRLSRRRSARNCVLLVNGGSSTTHPKMGLHFVDWCVLATLTVADPNMLAENRNMEAL